MKTTNRISSKAKQISLTAALAQWPVRRWAAAAGTAMLTYLVIAIPTDLIDTPLFIREIAPTWWAVPALVITAVLTGLLVATYVALVPNSVRGGNADQNDGEGSENGGRKDKGRFGAAGTIIAFFAVGCPVCNKLVLLALGTTGAVQYFEPLQPLLAVLSIGLLTWAFVKRTISPRTAARFQPAKPAQLPVSGATRVVAPSAPAAIAAGALFLQVRIMTKLAVRPAFCKLRTTLLRLADNFR